MVRISFIDHVGGTKQYIVRCLGTTLELVLISLCLDDPFLRVLVENASRH